MSTRFFVDLGIDFGVTNALVYLRDHGIILREPTLVAVTRTTGQIVLFGYEAKRVSVHDPLPPLILSPFQNGYLADYQVTEALLRHFFAKAAGGVLGFAWRRVVLAVSLSMTGIEREALKRAARSAGAREVYLIERPMAAAIGVGLPVQDVAGNIIIDIGGGTTEVALILLSEIVLSRSVRVGGDHLDQAIVNYVKRAYNLMIGKRTAEEIKIKIGSAFPPENPEKELTMEIKGRDLVAGLPKTLTITSQEVREALAEPINTIVESVRVVLARCPPEPAADLVDRGLVLVGGGALLRGLDDLLKQETGLPAHVAEDPLSAVAEGTGKVLSEIRFLRQMSIAEDDLRNRRPCARYQSPILDDIPLPPDEIDLEDPGDG